MVREQGLDWSDSAVNQCRRKAKDWEQGEFGVNSKRSGLERETRNEEYLGESTRRRLQLGVEDNR